MLNSQIHDIFFLFRIAFYSFSYQQFSLLQPMMLSCQAAAIILQGAFSTMQQNVNHSDNSIDHHHICAAVGQAAVILCAPQMPNKRLGSGLMVSEPPPACLLAQLHLFSTLLNSIVTPLTLSQHDTAPSVFSRF